MFIRVVAPNNLVWRLKKLWNKKLKNYILTSKSNELQNMKKKIIVTHKEMYTIKHAMPYRFIKMNTVSNMRNRE